MRLFLGLVVCFLSFASHAQKQLLLFKGERVVLRLYPGDDIVYRLKGSKTIKRTYVNNLSDTAVVTHRDTVAFASIDRLYFRQSGFHNTVGTLLVAGGVGYFFIDQVNQVVVQGNEFSTDNSVTRVSVGALAAGLPMMLIHKKSQRLRYPYKLMMVDKGSVFYRPDPRKRQSPFLID